MTLCESEPGNILLEKI